MRTEKKNRSRITRLGADPGAKSHFHMAKFTKLKMTSASQTKIHWLLLKLFTVCLHERIAACEVVAVSDKFFKWIIQRWKYTIRPSIWLKAMWQISICIQAPLYNRTVTFAGNNWLLDTVDVSFATKYETNWNGKRMEKKNAKSVNEMTGEGRGLNFMRFMRQNSSETLKWATILDNNVIPLNVSNVKCADSIIKTFVTLLISRNPSRSKYLRARNRFIYS